MDTLFVDIDLKYFLIWIKRNLSFRIYNSNCLDNLELYEFFLVQYDFSLLIDVFTADEWALLLCYQYTSSSKLKTVGSLEFRSLLDFLVLPWPDCSVWTPAVCDRWSCDTHGSWFRKSAVVAVVSHGMLAGEQVRKLIVEASILWSAGALRTLRGQQSNRENALLLKESRGMSSLNEDHFSIVFSYLS